MFTVTAYHKYCDKCAMPSFIIILVVRGWCNVPHSWPRSSWWGLPLGGDVQTSSVEYTLILYSEPWRSTVSAFWADICFLRDIPSSGEKVEVHLQFYENHTDCNVRDIEWHWIVFSCPLCRARCALCYVCVCVCGLPLAGCVYSKCVLYG